MSNFKERHPPMGSEKDSDIQTSSKIDQSVVCPSSSSPEELDELSLRVQALLAESSGDEQILEDSSGKESAIPSHPGTDIYVSCSSASLDSHPKADKVCSVHTHSSTNETYGITHSSTNETYGICAVQSSLTYSYSSDALEQKSEHFEGLTGGLYSGSDVTVIDLNKNPPGKSVNELEISKDFSSSYPSDEVLEKHYVDYHSKSTGCRSQLPEVDSFFSSSKLFFYSPYETTGSLSAGKKSNNFNYPAFSSPQLEVRDEKYSDCDTPCLSVSSVASSKHLEWDSAADIGYARSTVDESGAQSKSRKEPGGFSMAVNKLSYPSSSNYKSSAKQQLSAESASISENAQTSDLNKKSLRSAHTYIKTSICEHDKSVKETLDYSKAKLSSVTENSNIQLKKGEKMHFISDASVRPKTYVEKDEESARKNISLKDVERNIMHLKDTEHGSMFQNRDSEMLKKRVSFASGETHEENVKFVGIMKSPGDINPLTSFEHFSCHSISDPTEEYQRHVLFSPLYIDNQMLRSSDYLRLPLNQMLSSSDYRQLPSNQTSSSSDYLRLPVENSPEVLPHIRWYPLPSYKSSQDIKNAATQTFLRDSKEAGTSLDINVDVDEIVTISPGHLHVKETVDIHPIDRLQEWQVHEDINIHPNVPSQYTSDYINHANIMQYSNRTVKTNVSKEFIPSQMSQEFIPSQMSQEFIPSQMSQEFIPSLIQYQFEQNEIDRNSLNQCHLPQQEVNFPTSEDSNQRVAYEAYVADDVATADNVSVTADVGATAADVAATADLGAIANDVTTANDETMADDVAIQYHFDDDRESELHGIFVDREKDERDSERGFKDASTQINNCDCFIEFKNMLKRALDKVPVEKVCSFNKILKETFESTMQTERGPLRSDAFDILFLDDNIPKVLDSDYSPLYFNSSLMSSLKYMRKSKGVRRLPKKEKERSNRQIALEKRRQEEQKIILKKMFRSTAKEFSNELAKSTVEGKVVYSRHERVLKKSLY